MAGSHIAVRRIFRTSETGKKTSVTTCWHPECWIEQGKIEADKKPFEITKPGRKALLLPDDMKQKRLEIQRRRASVVQRIGQEIIKPAPNSDRIVRFGEMLEQFKKDILPFGGIPKSWEY
jgi:hypothetical protein